MNRLWPKWYRPKRRVAGFVLIDEAARYINVSPSRITGHERDKLLVAARAAIARILRDSDVTLVGIAKVLGGRDHSTIRNLLDVYPYKSRVKDDYFDILTHLRAVTA